MARKCGMDSALRWFWRSFASLALGLALGLVPCPAQTVFLDFNSSGQYSASFNPWNDNSGANGHAYAFSEDATAGIAGTGAIAVTDNNDTTATYQKGSWDFATQGATVVVSALIKANGQTSGNKVQLGILNSYSNGLNNNAGVAFASFRVIPQDAATWSLREQYRSANTINEAVLGNISVVAGHWYKFVIGFTNTSGASGDYGTACDLLDYGANGVSPGPSVVPFATARTHTGQDIAKSASVWPGLRAFQNGGIDAWDNFLVYTSNSTPVVTWPLTNTTAEVGSSVAFTVLADGPGPRSFSWYTNAVSAAGALNSFSIPAVDNSLTNVVVVIANRNGSVTNSATVSTIVPTLPVVINLPATQIQADSATLNGQMVGTTSDTPRITLYYGPADGGTNGSSWAQQISLGPQSGPFAQTVTGLSAMTKYFFTAMAENVSGVAWAAPSSSFSTSASNASAGAVAVLTQHNDLSRTGANLAETVLNTTNVNVRQFGLLYTRPVDDQIYAQPLLMTNVALLGKGTRNLLIVTTVNDSIYAYDADDATITAAYWQTNFLGPNLAPPRNTDMTAACGGNYLDFTGNMGIVGTPVIDPASGTLYVVVRTVANHTTFVQKLHALDVATGEERPHSPVVIAATYPGQGFGNVNGIITFDPQRQNQRPALALVNNTVYIAWASHCDWLPYNGWVIGYDATSLERTVVYNDTSNGAAGGIWMSGQGPAADAEGNLYLSTGNGTVGSATDPRNLLSRSESFLKLTPNGAGGLDVTSWFTPYNWLDLVNRDVDLGSAGLILIPGTTLAFSGGKGGTIYVVNRDNMGGLSDANADTNIVQSFQVSSDQIHGSPVWWDGPDASSGYLWPSSEHLRQYHFDRTIGKFVLPAYAMSSTVAPNGHPGGILSVSANGNIAGTGIVWASHQMNGDANHTTLPGILHAYDAQNVGKELWNSEQAGARDRVGDFAKFVPPTVANGKVYLATFSNRLNVYGLLPAPALAISRSGDEVDLSWRQEAFQNYQLQSNTSFEPQNWTDVNLTPTIVNGVYHVRLAASANSSFFRLRE